MVFKILWPLRTYSQVLLKIKRQSNPILCITLQQTITTSNSLCWSWSKIPSNIVTQTLHFWSRWLSLTNSNMSNKRPLCPPCDIIHFRAHNANTSVPMSVVIWLANIMDKWNSGHVVHAVTTTIVLLIHVVHMWGSHLLIVTIYVKYVGVAVGSIFWTCGRLIWVLVDVYTIYNKTEWL